MPLYDYKCKKCNNEFEEMFSVSEAEKKKPKCPVCGQKSERQITNPKHYKHLSWATWKV